MHKTQTLLYICVNNTQTMILNLDAEFKPIIGNEITFESFVFNGGEPHIRIHSFKNKKEVHVTHRINSFNDLGKLCVAIDALRRMGCKNIHLVIPYFPGARQDRVMVDGESLTVQVYARIINSLKADSVTIIDPHSDVTPALIVNCISIPNHKFIQKVLPNIPKGTLLISPDAGAAKKVNKLATQLKFKNVLECGKKRNVETGELSGFSVPIEDLHNKPCLIVDDICDGGGTFLGLGKELKSKNAGKLFLAVSHGIFSKGVNELATIFEEIFTTDSIRSIQAPRLTQIKLQDILNQNI